MAKKQYGLGHTRLTVPGRPDLTNKTAVVKVGDKTLEEALEEGGVSDYSDLTNKPSINGVELSGNKTSSELGIATSQQGVKADTAYQKPSSGIPQSDLSSDVQSQLNKHFKGWYNTLAELKAAHTATDGDSAYVKDASPATTWSIYVYDSTASSDNYWADSGRTADTSNVQTFASGQEVNEVNIDDTHIESPTAGSLALANDVKDIKDDIVEDGVTKREFTYSIFTSELPSITLSDAIVFSQPGDYVEFKLKANNTGPIIRRNFSYNQPSMRYSAQNTFLIRFTVSQSPFAYQDTSKVDNTKVQTIKCVLDSVSDNTYNFSIYIDDSLAGTHSVTTTGIIQYDQIGYDSIMELYYLRGKSNGIDFSFTKFSEITGATGVTDVYSSEQYDGLVPLNERVAILEAESAALNDAVFGEDMYVSFTKNSSVYHIESHFAVYQRLKGNYYIGTIVGLYTAASDIYPKGYWRIERTNLVTIINGVVSVIENQIIVPGENEFVLKWLAGEDYNADGGFTGGYHYGEKIDGVTGAWVEFIVDGNRIATNEDIPLTPCKSFLYREYSAIYNCHDNPASIAAWHLKETEFKDGGYETINDVKFVQALDYFAYPGIVCVSRWLSENAMPEDVATITDMGDGSTTIAEQFKSNGHRIHYEGNGYMCDVESEVLIGADDTQCQRVVYNSSAYNKFYRRNPDTVGSTSNRLKGQTKVKISAM